MTARTRRNTTTGGLDTSRTSNPSNSTTKTISNLGLPHGCNQDVLIMQQAMLELVALFESTGKLAGEIPAVGDSSTIRTGSQNSSTQPATITRTLPPSRSATVSPTTSATFDPSSSLRGVGDQASPKSKSRTITPLHSTQGSPVCSPRHQDPTSAAHPGEVDPLEKSQERDGTVSIAASPVPRLKNLAELVKASEEKQQQQAEAATANGTCSTPLISERVTRIVGKGRPLTLERILQFHFNNELQVRIATVISTALQKKIGVFQTPKDVINTISNRIGTFTVPTSPGSPKLEQSEADGRTSAIRASSLRLLEGVDLTQFVHRTVEYLSTRSEHARPGGLALSSTFVGSSSSQGDFGSLGVTLSARGPGTARAGNATARRTSMVSAAPKRKEGAAFLEIERINAIARTRAVTSEALELWRTTLSSSAIDFKPLPLPMVDKNLSSLSAAKPPTSDILEVVDLIFGKQTGSNSKGVIQVPCTFIFPQAVSPAVPLERSELPWSWDSVIRSDPFWLQPRMVNWHSDTARCELCGDKFGIINRKHHCRSCGKCVCKKCSPHNEALPDVKNDKGDTEPVRICDSCFRNKAKLYENLLLDTLKKVPNDNTHLVKRAALCSHWWYNHNEVPGTKRGSRTGSVGPFVSPRKAGGGGNGSFHSSFGSSTPNGSFGGSGDRKLAASPPPSNLWTQRGATTTGQVGSPNHPATSGALKSGSVGATSQDKELEAQKKLVSSIFQSKAPRTNLVLRCHQVAMLPIDLLVDLLVKVNKRELEFFIPVIFLTSQLPAVFFLGKMVELGGDLEQVSCLLRHLAVLAPLDQLEEVTEWLLTSQYTELLPFLVAVLQMPAQEYLQTIVEARGPDVLLLGIAHLQSLGLWSDDGVQRSAIQTAEKIGSTVFAKTVLSEITKMDNAVIASQSFQVVSCLYKGSGIADDLLVLNQATQDQAILGAAVRLMYGSQGLLDYVSKSLHDLELLDSGTTGGVDDTEKDLVVACAAVALQLVEEQVLVNICPDDLNLIARWLGAGGILMILEVIQRSDRTSVMSIRYEDEMFGHSKVGTPLWQALLLSMCSRVKNLIFAAIDEVIQEIELSGSDEQRDRIFAEPSLAQQRFEWNDAMLRKKATAAGGFHTM